MMKKIFGFVMVNALVILGMIGTSMAGELVLVKPIDEIPHSVPEPMTLLLIGAGAGAYLGARGLTKIIRKK